MVSPPSVHEVIIDWSAALDVNGPIHFDACAPENAVLLVCIRQGAGSAE